MKTDTRKIREYVQQNRGLKTDKAELEKEEQKIKARKVEKKTVFKNKRVESIIDRETPSFEEITNENDKEFSSNKDRIKVKIKSKLSQEDGISFGDEKHSIRMIPITDKSEGVTAKRKYKSKDEIVFNSFKGEDDLEYQVTEKGLKENITINQVQSSYQYDFELRLENLELYNEEGKVIFKDKQSGELLYKFSNLFMQDSAGATSNNIVLELERKSEDTWLLKVIPDAQWLNDSKRQFPIKLDPSIETCQEELIKLTWKNIMGSTLTPQSEKDTIGVKNRDMKYVNIHINLSPIINEIWKGTLLSNYKCILELFYIIGTRPASTPGYCVIDKEYTQIYLQDYLNKPDGKLTIDFTSFVKKAVTNNLNSLDLLLYLKGAWGSSQALEGADFDPNVEDYIYIYHDGAKDENRRPQITFEYKDNNDDKAEEKTYELGSGGTSFINLKSGKHRHEIFDASISHNSLSVDLKHVYRLDCEMYNLGKGWMTNLHQRLIKDPDYNTFLGSKDITYVDGAGYHHLLHERWYYQIKEVKHYVKKEDIYLDTDQKLKYKKGSSVYEVKYEVINDEGLSYISGSSLANYKNKAKFKKVRKYFIPCMSGRIELGEDIDKTGRYIFPIYASSSTKTKLSENGLPQWIKDLYPGKTEVYRLNIISYRELVKEANGTIKDKYGNAVHYVKNLYGTVTINKNGLYKIRSLSRVYYGGNNNSDPLIESFENDGFMVNLSYEDVLIENNAVEGDYYVSDELKQINDQLESLNENLENLKLNLRSSCFGITSSLDDIKLKKLTYAMINESGSIETGTNKYSINHGIDNAIEQKEISIDSFAFLEKNIWDIETRITNLKSQKQAMIVNQKREVNDFIIDKEGNILGFDGYGKLILIQDKYENEIRIIFDDKTINSNRISAVESDTQRIQFNYENDRLKSIKDTKGRLMKFSYNGILNEYLTNIILPNRQNLVLDCDFKTFKIINDLKQQLQVDFTYSLVSRVTIEVNGQGTQEVNGVLRPVRFIDVKDNYAFTNNMVTIRDKNTKCSYYYLDVQGRVIDTYDEISELRIFTKYSGKNTDFKVECDFNKSLKAFSMTGISKTITKEFSIIENGIPTPNQLLRTLLPDDQMMAFIISLGDFAVENLNIVRLEGEIIVTDKDNTTHSYTQIYDERELQNIAFPFPFDKSKVKSIKFVLNSSIELSISNVQQPINLVPCTGQIMKYDLDEKLRYVDDGYKNIYYDTYDGDNPSEIRVIENGITKTIRTVYSETGKITYQEDSLGNCLENYYDEKDQLIEKRTYNKGDPSLCKVERTSYDEKGNAVSLDGLLSNQNGEYPSTEFTYLPNSRITSKVKSPDGQVTTYTYDYETEDLLSISLSADGQNNATVFTYNFGLLTSMMHHGFGFIYDYDGLGRRKSVKVSSDSSPYLLTTYTDDYSNQVLGISYGQYVKNQYLNGLVTETYTDQKGLVKKSTINGKETLYSYDNKDRLIEKTYDAIKESTIYVYGDYGNIISTTNSKKSIEELKVENTFANVNTLTQQAVTLNNSLKYYLSYDVDQYKNNQIKAVSIKLGTVGSSAIGSEIERVDFEYDALGRVIKQELKNNSGDEVLCDEYEYLKDGDNTLDIIRGHQTKLKGALCGSTSYEYDVAGNITKIITDEDQTRYSYDKLNRLIREDNPKIGCSITYKYDTAGNIVLKKTHAYSLEDNLFSPQKDTFTYGCKGWKDQLLSFNGEKFVYDNMGRPTTFRNHTLVWNKEGTLQKFDNYTYTYNSEGIRTSITVDGVTEKYVLDGTKILRRTITSPSGLTKDFVYRYAIDKLIGFRYSNNEYIYRRNIQGDITHIYTIAGQLVAQYVYDAYGNHMVLTASGEEDSDVSSIGNLNPFRYRGYIFDRETELYYLNARYYDPELGRFISPDILSILDETRGQINGLNLYMYCGNNPVMRVDPSGYAFFSFLIGLAITWAITTIAGQIFGEQIVSGLGMAAGGVQSILTGISLLAYGPVGWILGGIGIVAGVGSLIFASAEIQQGVGGGNWIKDAGLSDGLYNGLMWTSVGLSTIVNIVGPKYMSSTHGQIAHNARYWDKGTFRNSRASLRYHYGKHGGGMSVAEYTNSARTFMTNNAAVLKYTYNYKLGNASWYYNYLFGHGGYFTSSGKIITFW